MSPFKASTVGVEASPHAMMQTVSLPYAPKAYILAGDLSQVFAMTALCISTTSIVASITTANSEAAIRAALAFSILGVITNVLSSVLLELRGRRTGHHLSQRLQGWVVSLGALWPVLALICLLVGTQPIAVVAVAGAVGGLVVVGLVAVIWFE